MSIKKKIKEINEIGKEPKSFFYEKPGKEDLDVALFMVLQRQIHEHETLRLTKEKLLEIIKTVNKL